MEEQEVASCKHAQEEENEMVAHLCVVDEHERVDHQCTAEVAEGSSRSGIQASDFNIFDTPMSLEHR